MTPLAYFKLQARNLQADTKTQFFNEDKEIWDYKPRFFNVNGLVLDFDLDEKDPKFKTLGKAQWIISQILGLKSWQELIHSDPVTLELYKLMFEHQNEISPIEWDGLFVMRSVDGKIVDLESPEEKLEFFKVLLGDTEESWSEDGYLLKNSNGKY